MHCRRTVFALSRVHSSIDGFGAVVRSLWTEFDCLVLNNSLITCHPLVTISEKQQQCCNGGKHSFQSVLIWNGTRVRVAKSCVCRAVRLLRMFEYRSILGWKFLRTPHRNLSWSKFGALFRAQFWEEISVSSLFRPPHCIAGGRTPWPTVAVENPFSGESTVGLKGSGCTMKRHRNVQAFCTF